MIQDNMMLVYMQKIEECKEQQKEIEKFVEKSFIGIDNEMIYERYIENQSYTAVGNKVHFSSVDVKRLIKKTIYRYPAR